jgi:hypothetical protein
VREPARECCLPPSQAETLMYYENMPTLGTYFSFYLLVVVVVDPKICFLVLVSNFLRMYQYVRKLHTKNLI